MPSLLILLSLSCVGSKAAPEQGAPPFLYTACDGHADCSKGMFCGIECWTGSCGADGTVPGATIGQFCQPCVQCEMDADSVEAGCDVCGGPSLETP